MSQPAGYFPPYSTERPPSGATRAILGFIVGALFALVPMYYLYVSRDAVLSGGVASQQKSLASAEAPSRRGAEASTPDGASKPFASRMTYELSQVPEELPPPRAKAPVSQVAAQPAKPAAVPPPAAAQQEDALATSRVVNSRPISPVPLEAPDTTREIGRDARRPQPDKAAPAPTPKGATQATQPRVIEGRDLEVKASPSPATPTRAIGTGEAVNTRKEIEAERRRAADSAAPPGSGKAAARKAAEPGPPAAPGPAIAGVTPISPPPEPPSRSAAAAPQKPVVTPPSPVAGGENADGNIVKGRLAATQDWLSRSPPTTHTLQLLGAGSEAQLKSHLRALSKSLDPGQLHVFRTVAQGKPSMTVVYGAYPDRKSALQALGQLPPAITAYKPVVRTVNGIRTEMKQHGTAQ